MSEQEDLNESSLNFNIAINETGQSTDRNLTEDDQEITKKLPNYSSTQDSYEDFFNEEDSKNRGDSKAQNKKPESLFDLDGALNPKICIASIIFKGAAIFNYLFVGMFKSSSVTVFIVTIILSAFDFWTTKNVSGRLLVGLRWWSEFDENGKEIWRYETRDQKKFVNPVDSFFFWGGNLAAFIIWAWFLFFNILTLSLFWGTLNLFCAGMVGTNLFCFYKCRGAHQQKLSKLQEQAKSSGLSWLTSMFLKKASEGI